MNIEFRAWDVEEECWVPSNLVAVLGDINAEHRVLTFDVESGRWCNETSPVDISLFTGLLDRNGMRMFEGDIVEYTQHLFNAAPDRFPRKRGVIKFEGGRFTLDGRGIYGTAAGRSDFVVVGNIFERAAGVGDV